MSANPVPDLNDRFRGAMLGTAVGDCLGRPVEGHRHVSRSYLDEIVQSPPKLLYTDDTAMTLAVAESLLGAHGFEGSDLATRFVTEYEAAPHRGYGAGVVTVFDRVARGIPWTEAAGRQFGGQGSYGNGAAMRVTPVALWAYPDFAATAALAADTARVTHTHPIGVDGAVLQAAAVHVALGHAADEPLAATELFALVFPALQSDEVRSKLAALTEALDRADDAWAADHLGHGVAADTSVITALYCAWASSTFEEAIIRSIGLGGDTDTIAAMTGAIAGAHRGIAAIPDRWRSVEESDRLLDLADALYARHHTAGP